MTGTVNMAAYHKVARMSASLNRFMHEAMIAKTQIASSLSTASISSITGIGKNIDTFA